MQLPFSLDSVRGMRCYLDRDFCFFEGVDVVLIRSELMMERYLRSWGGRGGKGSHRVTDAAPEFLVESVL